jgi:hypothetical protein
MLSRAASSVVLKKGLWETPGAFLFELAAGPNANIEQGITNIEHRSKMQECEKIKNE